MPSTYTSLHYHIVFSTKDRIKSIAPDWRESLHSYLAGAIAGLEGAPQRVGGVEDHVHLLVGLKTTHCIADVLRELKKTSSLWVHNEIGRSSFAWQEGYSIFTVSANAREAVKSYIDRQEEHHRQKSFGEELMEMLDRPGVDYDPKYFD